MRNPDLQEWRENQQSGSLTGKLPRRSHFPIKLQGGWPASKAERTRAICLSGSVQTAPKPRRPAVGSKIITQAGALPLSVHRSFPPRLHSLQEAWRSDSFLQFIITGAWKSAHHQLAPAGPSEIGGLACLLHAPSSTLPQRCSA